MQAVANFNEYYCIAIKHDQIKLTSFAAPVPGEGPQALCEQVAFGPLLGLLAALLMRWQPWHQRAVSARRLT